MAKKIFNKRTLAAAVALIMMINMVNIGVLAEENTPPALVQNFADTYYKQDGTAGTASDWEIHLSKTAAATDEENVFDITLKVETKDIAIQTAGTTDGAAVLVLDVSNSMNTVESGCAVDGCAEGKRSDIHCMNYEREYFWKDQCENCGQTRDQHNDHHRYTASNKTQLDSLKAAVADFLDAFADGAKTGEKRMVAVVVFGTKAKTIQTWVDVNDAAAIAALKAKINTLSTGDSAYLGNTKLFAGGTNMEGGLVLGRNLLGMSELAGIPVANQSLILFSDGAPTVSVSNAASTATDSIGYSGDDIGYNTNRSDYDDVASILSGVSAAKIVFAYNYNDDLGILETPPFTRVINSGAGSLSVDLQAEAGKVITSATNASSVTDPMGTGVSMITVTSDYNAGTTKWDLSKFTPTVADGITTYTITYQVRIDADAVELDPAYPGYTILTPANGQTTLDYTYGENSTEVHADFNEPNIRGIRSFTVSYDYEGNVPDNAPELPATEAYKAGQSVQVAAAPALENFTFSGWSKADFVMPAEDVVIVGRWTENNKYDYELSYNANFGANETLADEENVAGIYDTTYGIKVNANTFVRDNYTFIGWNTEADGSGKFYSVDETVALTAENNTEVLYAQWSENPKYGYSVIYNANFGANETLADEENVAGIYDTTYGIKVNTNTFVRDNYTFIGWNTEADGSGKFYSVDEAVALTAENNTEVLYAQWQINSYDYEVVYKVRVNEEEYAVFTGTLPQGAPVGGSAEFGAVINKASLQELGLPGSLSDEEYTYELDSVDGIVIAEQGNVVTVYYTCIVEIEEIPEEDVPMADLPKTGDPIALMVAGMAVLSGTGTVVLLKAKKSDEEETAE